MGTPVAVFNVGNFRISTKNATLTAYLIVNQTVHHVSR